MNTLPERKRKLIEAAIGLILRQGFSGTSVDQICAEADVTKGSFFHYFSSKEEIGRAAMEVWTDHWVSIIEHTKFDEIRDPWDRVQKLLDVMENAYLTQPVGPGCVVGTIAQELALSNPAIFSDSARHLETWTSHTSKLLTDAKGAHPPRVDFDPVGLADYMMSIVQGTLLAAKTRPDKGIITNNMAHLRAYINCLFGKGDL